MAYALTQDDIDRYGLTGAKVGEIANPADRALMGMPPDEAALSLQTPVGEQTATPPAATLPATPAAAPMVNNQQALAGLLTQAIPQDPFENLSRGQRTMMGFAALKDAGFALQGKEGTAVRGVIDDITNRADMERKRQGALARNQMMANALGGGAAGAGAQPQTAEEYRAAAQNLARQIAVMGDAGQALVPMLNQYMAEAERLGSVEQSEVSVTQGSAESFETVTDLIQTVTEKEGVTGFWGMVLGKIPFTAAYEARVDVQTLRSNMALGALVQLKSDGGTLGSVSEKELELLESDIKKIDFNQTKPAVLKDLKFIQDRYKNVIRAAYRDTSQPEKLDAVMEQVFGEVPSWVGGAVKEYTVGSVTVGNMIFDAEDQKYFEYLGGDKNDASSWREM